jgi:hypothetical protein
MNQIAIVFTICLISLFSCKQPDPNKQVDEGNVKGEIYHSNEIGWSIKIPSGWSVTSRDETEKRDKLGADLVKKSNGIDVDSKGLKHLIGFHKDQVNSFFSTAEPFKETYPGEYKKNNVTADSIIYKAVKDQGIKMDTATGKEIIQGLEFSTFSMIIYGADGKEAARQIMYSKLLNGFDFTVVIIFNNEKDKNLLVSNWKGSTFGKK